MEALPAELTAVLQWVNTMEQVSLEQKLVTRTVQELNSKLTLLESQFVEAREALKVETERLDKVNTLSRRFPPPEVRSQLHSLIQRATHAPVSSPSMKEVIQELSTLAATYTDTATTTSVPKPISSPSMKAVIQELSTVAATYTATTASVPKPGKVRKTSLDWVKQGETRMTPQGPPLFDIEESLHCILGIRPPAVLYTTFERFAVDGHKRFLETLGDTRLGDSGMDFYEHLAQRNYDGSVQTFLFESTAPGFYHGIVRDPSSNTYVDCPMDEDHWTRYDAAGKILDEFVVSPKKQKLTL
jgi:hypothetical protein